MPIGNDLNFSMFACGERKLFLIDSGLNYLSELTNANELRSLLFFFFIVNKKSSFIRFAGLAVELSHASKFYSNLLVLCRKTL